MEGIYNNYNDKLDLPVKHISYLSYVHSLIKDHLHTTKKINKIVRSLLACVH